MVRAYLRENFGLYRCTVPLSVVIKEIARKKTILHMRINTEQLLNVKGRH